MFTKILLRSDGLVAVLAALVLFAMMLLVFSDVFARYVFDVAIYGRDEIIEIMMAFLAFALLPRVSVRDGNIKISLLDGALSGTPAKIHSYLVDLVTFFSLSGVAWIMYSQGETLRSYGSKTQILKWPEFPIAYVIAAICALGAGLFACRLLAPARFARVVGDN